MPRTWSAIGDANGSSSKGYAAVFGRCDFVSEGMNFAKTSPDWTAGAGCVKKTLCSFSSKTAGPPPAGSMNAYPYRLATDADGAVRRVEKGPNTRATLSFVMKFW